YHFHLNRFRFAGQLRIIADLRQKDLFLFFKNFRRDRRLIQIAGIYSSDLHSNILAEGNKLRFSSNLVGGIKLNQNTMSTAAVYISSTNALVTLETTDFNVLADNQNFLLQSSLDSAITHFAGQKRSHISGILVHNYFSYVFNEPFKQIVLCNEVRFSVN